MITIQKGERPNKPVNAGLLGFSDRLRGLVSWCWGKSPSTQPTARDLLRCLQDISPTWVFPLKYPIPDDPDGEASPDFISRSEWIMGTDVLKSGFFALLVAMLRAFMLSFD